NFGFAALGRFHYCAAMLLARITSPQSLSSRLSSAPAASGVCWSGANTSMPPSWKVLGDLASASACRSAPVRRSTVARGGPAGRGRAGGRKQHVQEIETEFFVAAPAQGGQPRQAGEAVSADDGVALDLAGLDKGACAHRRYGAQIGDARQQVVERRSGAAIRH